jgi:Flp pilus assembly pilin Flp
MKDEVTILFRQRRMRVRVIRTKKMKGSSEFRVGMQALTQERDASGLNFAGPAKHPVQPFQARLRFRRLHDKGRAMEGKGNRSFAWLKQLWSEEKGQDIAEYSIMLAVILVIVAGTVRLIGSNANHVFSEVGSAIQ